MFDQHIKSGDGELAGIQIDTLQPDITTICRRCMHAVLGHPSTETTNMTAKIFFLNIMLHDKICESYIQEKQHQKNIPKKTELKAEKVGERVFFI